MKSDTGHAGWRARTQQQRSIDLAGENATRLEAPLAVLQGLEGFAPVQDQLVMANGNDAPRRRIGSVVFRDPETVEETAAGVARARSRETESLRNDSSNRAAAAAK